LLRTAVKTDLRETFRRMSGRRMAKRCLSSGNTWPRRSDAATDVLTVRPCFHGRAEHRQPQHPNRIVRPLGERGTSEGALKVAIHRLRKRYRELFRQEIADTVADPAEVESELRYLAAVLARK
jgi:hypothetical protein